MAAKRTLEDTTATRPETGGAHFVYEADSSVAAVG